MKAILILLLATLSLSAKADIICHVQTGVGSAAVQIGESSVQISGAALERPSVYSHFDSVYDGHMTSLITAPGLSISYENWYGCIHNATITAHFRSEPDFIQTVKAEKCSGGSTSDDLCQIP
jgi:hypothetical protein